MSKMLAATLARLKRFLLTLLSLFRRVICIRKRRPSQDSLLPITISHGKAVSVTPESSTNHYYPTGSTSSPSATSYNQCDHQYQQTPFVGVTPSINSPATAVASNHSSASGGQFSQFSQTANWNSFSSKQLAAFDQVKQQQQQIISANKTSVESQREEEEEDFFRDMAPRVKQQRFFNVKQDNHLSNQQQQARSDRFNFDPTVAAISSSIQLGQLDEIDIDSPTGGSASTAWDEEVDTSEIEDQIRKVREEERRKRQAEHAARAKEKEKRNPNRTLSATKIS